MRPFQSIAAIGLSAVFLSFSSPAATSVKVYICKSNAAYAWHQVRDCRGLNKCTHEIEKVTKEEAVALGYKKPCGYCY